MWLRRYRGLRFRTYLSMSVALIVAIVVFAALGLNYLALRSANDTDREYSKRTISSLILNSVRGPLLQGGFVEAWNRIQFSVDRGDVACAALKIDSFAKSTCASTASATLDWWEVSLSQFPELSQYQGSLRLGFSPRAMDERLNRNIIYFSLFSALFGLSAFLLTRQILRFLDKEVEELSGALESPIDSRPYFRTIEFKDLFANVRALVQERARLISETAFAETAKSVAHDIRSPISALKILSARLNKETPEKELLEGAAGRLEGIASQLLEEARRSESSSITVGDMIKLSQLLANEFRMRFSHIQIGVSEWNGNTLDVRRTVVGAVRSEVPALMENLMKNSAEALDGRPNPRMDLLIHMTSEGCLSWSVRDNGAGFDPLVLDRIGKERITYGKANGTGYGLFYVGKKVRAWGGQLKVESCASSGSRVTLTLPLRS